MTDTESDLEPNNRVHSLVHRGRLFRIEDFESSLATDDEPVIIVVQVIDVTAPDGADIETYDIGEVLSDCINGSDIGVTVVELATVRPSTTPTPST